MPEYPTVTAGVSVSEHSITSRIARASTPQDLACVLAEEAFAIVPFDHCTLVSLSLPDLTSIHLWRVPRERAIECQSFAIDASDPRYAGLLKLITSEKSKILERWELEAEATDELWSGAKSVLALLLSSGGTGFGLLCFATARAGVYSTIDEGRLDWLSAYVAASTRAAMLQAHLETNSETQGEIERLKSGFVNTLVRHIRLPFTSVLGVLELFESKLQAREPFDLEDRQLLSSAIENGDRIRQLVDDLLEVARHHESPLALELETVEAEQILEEVAEPIRGEAALRGVELNVHDSGELLMRVDRRQTRRALNHLLRAALAATPDGGAVNVAAREVVGTRAEDEGLQFILISVADSSEGIKPEEVPFIFDAFWQAPDSRFNAGRGVGLAIAKRVAAAHGGNVSVRSQRGKGTVYSIVLPLAEREPRAARRRILIVEDVPELLLLLRKLVGRMGYQVETASGAEVALEVLRKKHIDLLLTDWAMPAMSGGQLVMEIRGDARLRDIPIIILTGHDAHAERKSALAAGCDRFLVKPVKRDELRLVIADLLARDTELTVRGEH
jgi:signal transduction histidine kinase/ActR/RegA family two-component response regulator